MVEAGQDGPFLDEPLLRRPPHVGHAQQLDRDLALEPSVVAAGEPDRAHPAHPDRRFEGVLADRLPRQPRALTEQPGRAAVEPGRPGAGLTRQQRLDQIGLLGGLDPELVEPRPSGVGGELEGLVEQGFDVGPALAIECGHDGPPLRR